MCNDERRYQKRAWFFGWWTYYYNFGTTFHKHPVYVLLELFDVINVLFHQLCIAKRRIERCSSTQIVLVAKWQLYRKAKKLLW